MRNSVTLTVQEVNQILVDYVANHNPHLTAKCFNVNWDLNANPPIVTIVEDK